MLDCKKYLLIDTSILLPISLIWSRVFLSSLNFSFFLTFSYIAAACAFSFDSEINLSCFLSVMGVVVHDGIIIEQHPKPTKPRNFLLFINLFICYYCKL